MPCPLAWNSSYANCYPCRCTTYTWGSRSRTNSCNKTKGSNNCRIENKPCSCARTNSCSKTKRSNNCRIENKPCSCARTCGCSIACGGTFSLNRSNTCGCSRITSWLSRSNSWAGVSARRYKWRSRANTSVLLLLNWLIWTLAGCYNFLLYLEATTE